MAADSVVPEPGNPQALNRFSYCYNNPLKYTDPTGHMIDPGGPTGKPPEIPPPPDPPPYPPELFENYPQARGMYEQIYYLEAEGITPYKEGEEYQERHIVTEKGARRNEKRIQLTTLRFYFMQLWNRYRVNFADSPEDIPREVYDYGIIGTSFGVAAVGGKAVSWLGDNVGPTIDPRTEWEVGRFVVDPRENVMIEPVGGRTVTAGRGGVDTHTLYPNGSNYQRLNPVGHPRNPTPHAHGHLLGTGPGMRGQGPSISIFGNVVPWNSPEAHWPIW